MNRLEQLRGNVQTLYEAKHPERADWSDWLYKHHVMAVGELAAALAVRFDARADLAAAAGMLHDIADAVMSRFDSEHEAKSVAMALTFLREAEFSTDEIAIVEDALVHHGCHNGQYPKTLEGKVMATADAVAHLTTDFYAFAESQMMPRMSPEDFKAWILPKLERDFNEKIFFPEVQAECDSAYQALTAHYR